ncbi:DUF1295 domain-containing protein [Candidatus Saccharibacteria bacterium]|nr:DUF1295 domain-containing protein [Candidatus Saccharibacteria bacterium]
MFTLWCNLVGAMIFMTLAFAVAQWRKRLDIADIAWGLVFIVIAVTSYAVGGTNSTRPLVMTTLVTLWGLRLSAHIFLRFIRKPDEDRRYAVMREGYVKHPVLLPYFKVFISQGLLALVITLPLTIACTTSDYYFGWLSGVGVFIWGIGFFFETLGDSQLMMFLGNKRNKGKLMTTGLWSLTRHPNYFGEITQWWGIGIIALATPYGWIGLLGPLTITFLIVKVSGVPLLEQAYAGRPDWEAYKAKTNKLIPWRRKATVVSDPKTS